MAAPRHPGDALRWWVRARGGPACIGIDPVLEKLPASVSGATPVARIEAWCLALLDAVEPHRGEVPVGVLRALRQRRRGRA
jgi:hypothetical protein